MVRTLSIVEGGLFFLFVSLFFYFSAYKAKELFADQTVGCSLSLF